MASAEGYLPLYTEINNYLMETFGPAHPVSGKITAISEVEGESPHIWHNTCLPQNRTTPCTCRHQQQGTGDHRGHQDGRCFYEQTTGRKFPADGAFTATPLYLGAGHPNMPFPCTPPLCGRFPFSLGNRPFSGLLRIRSLNGKMLQSDSPDRFRAQSASRTASASIRLRSNSPASSRILSITLM